MLSAPPRPSRWTGPPGQRSPTRSVPTSITSRLLRRPHPPLGSLDDLDLDLDRVERLDVASPDQGDEEASAEIGRPRPHRHTPPRRPRACGYDLPSGGGRVGPRDRRVAAGAAGRADPEVLGVLLSIGTSLRANEAAPNNWNPSELPWSERLSA